MKNANILDIQSIFANHFVCNLIHFIKDNILLPFKWNKRKLLDILWNSTYVNVVLFCSMHNENGFSIQKSIELWKCAKCIATEIALNTSTTFAKRAVASSLVLKRQCKLYYLYKISLKNEKEWIRIIVIVTRKNHHKMH